MMEGVYIDDEETVTKRFHYTLIDFACVQNMFERVGSWNR